MPPTDDPAQTADEQRASLEAARKAHGQEPGNPAVQRELFVRLLAAVGTLERKASFRPAAASLAEALGLGRALLAAGAGGPDDEARAAAAIDDALYVARRVPAEARKSLLEAASPVVEWLRAHGAPSGRVDAVCPQLRALLRQAGAGAPAGSGTEPQAHLDAAWETARREPRNPDGWRAVFAAAAVLGRFWRTQPEAAADAYLDAFLAWEELRQQGGVTGPDREAATRLVEEITAGRLTERTPSFPFTIRQAKLLAATAEVLAQLDTDDTPSARLATCAPALGNLRRQAGDREAPPPALVVPAPPVLPPSCARLLGSLDVRSLGWQVAHWDHCLEREAAVASLVESRFLVIHLTVNRLPPGLRVARAWTLPFYGSARLALLRPPEAGDEEFADSAPHAWALLTGMVPHRLGSAADLASIPRFTPLTLTEGNVAAYLRFLCFFVRAGREPLVVLDRRTFTRLTGADAAVAPGLFPDAPPVRAAGTADTYDLQTALLCAGQVYRASFRVSGDGKALLVDYEAGVPAATPDR